MRIGIDAHSIGLRAGGNETYMRELLFSLEQYNNSFECIALMNKDKQNILCGLKNIKIHPLVFSSSYMRVLFGLNIAIRQTDINLLHVQYNAPLTCKIPFVVSVHDISWRKHPEFLPKLEVFRHEATIINTMKRARRIFVLSDAVKNEIASIYDIPFEKFDLVQPSVSPIFKPVADEEIKKNITEKYSLPDKYILYLGALQPRKNLVRLAKAFSMLPEKDFPHKLVFVGKKAWLYKDMLKTISDLNLDDRMQFLGYVPLNDLPAILSSVSCFAYPSVYEGFGLPVIEAMACGAPVLISADPALTEVAGDAALSCDAHREEDIKSAMIKILTDENLSKTLSDKGINRAKIFTREHMASQVLIGYKKAI